MKKIIKNDQWAILLFSLYSYSSNLIESIINFFPQFIRNRLFRFLFQEYGRNTMIDYKCFFRYPWRIKIGNNVAINRGCKLYPSMRSDDGYIILEDNVILGPNVTIFSAGHDYSLLNLPDNSSPVLIGRFAWVGGNTTILPGVTIGEGAIIGAGSVVTKNIPPYKVAVGNPAKVIKSRILIDKSYPQSIVNES